MEGYYAEIRIFAGIYAPKNWAFCDGRTLPIAEHSALYALIGVTYGGNGQTTFNLPDLRGRVAIHAGQGVGLSNYPLGAKGGVETIPAPAPPVNTSVVGTVSGALTAELKVTPAVVVSATSSQAQTNVQPYLCVNYIICLQGMWPQQD
jgi:microcystin-dependent protein